MQRVARSLMPISRHVVGLTFGLLAALLLVAVPARAQLNGTYTVGGVSPNYATIDAAVAALNSGVSGPVTFLIRTGTYTPPTNGWRLPLTAGMSATNRVTFRPDVGATVLLSGNTGTTTQTGVFTLDGGKYYTIDGSNVSGGTTKNMTVISTEINYNPAIFFKNDADFNIVRNCNLQAASTSYSTFYGMGVVFFGPTTTISGNDSNMVQNCTIGDPAGATRCYIAIGMYGQNTIYQNIGNKIIGCDVVNFRYYGIWIDNYNVGPIIQKNLVHMTVPGITSSVYGIYINETSGLPANATIDSNKIYKLIGTSTSSQSIFGIYSNTSSLPNGTTQISNNMISFYEDGYIYYYPIYINSNYSSASASTLTYNVYYNSIYLGGAATSFAQAFGLYRYAYNSSGVGVANTVNHRNNIYYSTRYGGSSTSYGLYVYASPVGGWNSNNNLIQLNTDPSYYTAYFNFSLYQTLPSYQTSGQDPASVGGNPQFVDPSVPDLHVVTTRRTPVEGRASVVAGQTTDYDGQARSGVTPDIGADEGSFLPTIALDADADRIVAPLNNATVKSSTLFSPIGFFSNLSTTTQTVPVRMRILNASSTVVYNDLQTFSVTAMTAPGKVTFNQTGNVAGSTSLTAGVYTVELGTELVGDGDATNNKVTISINVKDPLNGIYTINKLGAGLRNYTSFTGAIADLNVLGVTAPVTFKIATGVYDSTTETFPLKIVPAPGVTAINNVVFRPDSLAYVTMTNGTTNPIIDLVDADYITLSGNNQAPNNPRAFKIINTNTGPTIRLISGAQFDTVRNMYLMSINNTTGGVLYIANAPTSVANNDNAIMSNTIGDSTGVMRSTYGIYMLGDFSYQNARNRFEDNDVINFGNTGTGYGIYINSYNNFLKVFRNRITQTTNANTASLSTLLGIYVPNFYNNNDSLCYNKIWNLQTQVTTETQYGIYVPSPGQAFPFVIQNNMITLTSDIGPVYCLYIGAASVPTFYIDHNSISMRGNNQTTSAYVGMAFRMSSSANIFLRNNIITNERIWAYVGNVSYNIYRTTSGVLTSNYNILYANGQGTYVGYNGTTAYQTVPQWQTVSDFNSIAATAIPPFVDQPNGDLHIQTQPVFAGEGQGTVLNVLRDYDVALRDLLAPDIGADDGDFNGGGLREVYPNGGEVFQPNEVVPVQFTTNRIMSARIDFSTNFGGTWTPLATVNPTVKGLNTVNVTMPNLVAPTATIRVINPKNQYEFDTTDATFKLVRKLKLTYPNGGERLYAGDTTLIRWNRQPGEMLSDYLNFDLTTDAGSTWTNIEIQIPGYLDSLRWVVPHMPTNSALMRMSNKEIPKFWDTTDAVFQIVEPMISVVGPNGGEKYQPNAPITVTWNTQFVTHMRVDFTNDGGATWTTVGTNINPASGSYTFTPVPTPTTLALVRLVDMDRPRVNDQSDHFFKIGQSKSFITVYTPAAGDKLVRNSTTVITWDAPDISLINLQYSLTGGAPWTTIATNVDATEGSRVWSVPNQKTTLGKIRITESGGPGAGESGLFEIVDPISPTLTVVTPNGGEQYTAGDTINITWSQNDLSMVTLQSSVDNGANWKVIQANVPAALGMYKWVAPNIPSTNYLVRAVSVSPSAADVSNAVFTINAKLQPLIVVLYPNGGENLSEDSVRTIRWTANDVPGNVKIGWSPDKGVTWDTIATVPATDQKYDWTVPKTATKQALVRVWKPNSSPAIGDVSDTVFEISTTVVAQLKVLTPNGGEIWRGKEKQMITWEETPGVTSLDISFSTDGGQTWGPGSVIATDVPIKPAQYQWTVPSFTSKYTSVLVKITNHANAGQYDLSDAPFTLDQPIAGVNTVVAGLAGLKTLGAYPNPNTGVTELRWTQGHNGSVEIRLYGAQGSSMGTYDAGHRDAGEQRYVLNAPELVSGMYIWEVRMAEGVARGVMTVVK